MNMKSVWHLVVMGVVLCLGAAPGRAQVAGDWLAPQVRGEIDAIFSPKDGAAKDGNANDGNANGGNANGRPAAPGYALGVIKDGRLVVAKGYGLANLDDGIPITPQTAFHLASLSKQFTGAAVALLILDGKLSLEDPVAKYVPEAAKYGDGLRIKHLVYMTSGLHEYSDMPREGGQPWITFSYFTRDEAIRASLKADRLEFAPGTDWAYRNINYMLLTRVVETISGERFAAFLQRRVFGPAGMAHSLVDDDTTLVIPHRATGYAPRANAQVQRELAEHGVAIRPGDGWVRLVRVSPHFGGSGVFSSLEDLAAWDRVWYDDRLGAGFTALMDKRMKFAHDKDNDAFGLVWRERFGRAMLDYAGGDTDTSTYMARFPAERVTVICLANMPLGDAEGKAKAVMEVLHRAGKI